MKCSVCGALNISTQKRCHRCGILLPAAGEKTAAIDRDRAGTSPSSAAEDTNKRITAEPEWRKEVAEKVKAYGERKRILLTPPQPLKGQEAVAVELDHSQHDSETQSFEETSEKLDHRQADYLRPAGHSKQLPPLEVCIGDFDQPVRPDDAILPANVPLLTNRTIPLPPKEKAAEDIRQGQEEILFFWRRSVAWIIDQFIVVMLFSISVMLLSFLPQLSRFLPDAGFVARIGILFSQLPFLLLSVLLLLHFLYYVYFLKNPRQTPGMLFFALELRGSRSPNVPLQRVVVRWLCLVLLNVFNLVPLFQGKKNLLLDEFSGTWLRSLK